MKQGEGGKEEKGRKGGEKVGKAFSSDFGQTLRPMPLLFGKPILWVVAWLSGSALVSINVTQRRARLILGWVTVCRRVNHLGM